MFLPSKSAPGPLLRQYHWSAVSQTSLDMSLTWRAGFKTDCGKYGFLRFFFLRLSSNSLCAIPTYISVQGWHLLFRLAWESFDRPRSSSHRRAIGINPRINLGFKKSRFEQGFKNLGFANHRVSLRILEYGYYKRQMEGVFCSVVLSEWFRGFYLLFTE